MTPLLLVAASGLAREALEAVRASGTHNVIGYLDDDPALVGKSLDGIEVIGGIEMVQAHGDASLVVCAGRGSARAGLVSRLEQQGISGERYATIIHPSVTVPASCVVGRGTILLAGTTMTAAVSVGDHVVVMPHSVLTHDDVIDDFATLCAGVVLGGDVRVSSGAYLGMSAMVRERVVVGEGATVGMGSVVLRDIPAGETWAGNPARALPTRPSHRTGSP